MRNIRTRSQCAVPFGLLVSLLILIYRISFPGSAELGRDDTTGMMVDLSTHPQAERLPGVVIYRFDAPLIYSNAAEFTDAGLAYIEAGDELPQIVVIDCEVISYIDSTGVESLVSFVATLTDHDIDVRLARLHHEVRAALERSGALDEIGEDAILPRPDEILDELE